MYDELVKRLRAAKAVVFKTEDVTLLCDAADAIEELLRRCEQFQYIPPPAWIPVTERLPEIKEPVLAMVHWDDYGDTMMCYGCRYKTRWYLWNCVEGELLKDFTVTHWMPLPSTEGLDEA